MANDLTSEAFYSELTLRNRGLIADSTQTRLRDARFVIAGCGSTGGATVVPLARAGATRFLLADPDTFEISNLNRQDATVVDVGENKATVAARRILAINPHAVVDVRTDGFPTSQAADLLDATDIVIDAVDVTTPEGIAAKKALHEAACDRRVPVITAYDIAGCQYVDVFDYRRGGAPLRGKVGERSSPSEVLAALIPATALPPEILPVLLRQGVGGDHGFPQLGMTATLFGAMVVPVALRLLDGQVPASPMRVDLFALTTPRRQRAWRRIRTLARLPIVWWSMRRRDRL